MTFILGGNWKLQINRLGETRVVLEDLVKLTASLDVSDITIFVALPAATLFVGQEVLSSSKIKLAAQNINVEPSGAYTGEVSIESIIDLGVEYVLIGHSERRLIFGEQNTQLNQKIHLVLENGLTPVFCIGETAKERNSGKFETVITEQLDQGLAGITADQLKNLIIAYEPVWAINNPLLNPGAEIKAATPEEAASAHQFIRNWLGQQYSEELASRIPIQYGGSMKPTNAQNLLSLADINGGLIGGASLSAEAFGPIIKTAIELVNQ